MTESCPLGGGINWNNRNEIPEFCLENCQAIWEEASLSRATVDMISVKCHHDVEFEDESLQRIGGPQRLYSILNTCMQGCGEAFAEEWIFSCPRE
jgi:hypothetical protein